MKKGTVKFFNKDKGFGLIIPEEGGKDLFFFISKQIEEFREGGIVSYDLEKRSNGTLTAINVKVV
ncbi:MAG: cold-shock protein [Flavobacteriaceae bacterium]